MAAGYRLETLPAGAFTLSAYAKHGGGSLPILRVYLDSDGTPWDRGYWPARDPTPRRSLALALMALDPGPSAYLNRPCYGQPRMPAACSSDLWTHGRYSEAVVEAMNLGLDELRSRFAAERLVLIGHSGGGALAMLLAGRRQDVAALVTIAANLDHRNWTRHFGFEELSASLNSVDGPVLPAALRRWHLVGERDRIVPAELTVAAASRDPVARVRRYTDFDHQCCWERIWPQLLEELETALRND